MDKKVKELRRGLRLDIKKPPKAETPKNIYKRKQKHKYGRDYENLRPYFFLTEKGIVPIFLLFKKPHV
ncbi:MAG: hypothetical protein GXY14_11430 [Spirochaetes bacterium]|nr:hypothetical protein [Spirochaetota bacterium]